MYCAKNISNHTCSIIHFRSCSIMYTKTYIDTSLYINGYLIQQHQKTACTVFRLTNTTMKFCLPSNTHTHTRTHTHSFPLYWPCPPLRMTPHSLTGQVC